MIKLSDTQIKKIAIIAAAIYAAFILVVLLVLVINGKTTRQNREAQTTSVTKSLFEEEKAEVPQSWENEAPPTTQPEEQKAADKEAAAPVADKEPPPKAKPEEKPADKPADKPAAPEEKNTKTETPKDAPASQAPPAAQPERQAVALPEKAALPAAVQSTWQKFARPFDQQDVRPRIALIILDMGMASATTQSAIQDLPGAVSLAFSSLAPSLEADMLKARAAGHEMILTVPMEPNNYPQNDPGPGSLLVALPDAENNARLQRAMARTDGYVGIMPNMGEKFVTVENKMSSVLEAIQKEGLMIVDGTQAADSVIPALSRLIRVPFARVDGVIDAAARNALDVQLQSLESKARDRGQIVIAIKPYPVIFEKLATWIQTLDKKGIVLAPVSAVTSSFERVPVKKGAQTENVDPAAAMAPVAPANDKADSVASPAKAP